MNQTSFDLPIILGSSSKYRAEVLRQHHIPFTVRVASIDEKSVGGSYRTQPDPDALTLTVAQAKMDALLATLPTDTQPSLVMTCDQVVSFKGQIREKPETKEVRFKHHTFHVDQRILIHFYSHHNRNVDCIWKAMLKHQQKLIRQ